MLISPAYAQAAGGEGGMLTAILPLILIFAVFYFLLIRPQQKRMKQHKQMIEAVRRGDKVVTAGGLIATVHKVQDNEIELDLAEGVRVKAVRSTLSEVLTKPQPAANDGGKGGEKDEKGDTSVKQSGGILGGLLGGRK